MAENQLQHPAPNPDPAPAPAPNGMAESASHATKSLYVGDLDPSVTDAQLFDLFIQVSSVVSVRVCRDMTTKMSLGYGYVNFSSSQEAAKAMDILNFTPLNNKPIRLMYSHRDPSLRKSGAGNIFIKNLDKSIDTKSLYDTFSSFGSILSCKVATDSFGESKGYGFVQFDNEESAQAAIENLNGMLMNDKQVFVGRFLRRDDRENSSGEKFNNVFVKNISESTTDEDLKKVFGEYGSITSAVVMRAGDGKSKGFGFVNFENADDAARAVEALNGKKFDEKEWYVGKAQKKSEREQELRAKFEKSSKEASEKVQGANLYVKNLDDSITDEKMRELFSEFGSVTSCKVLRDPSGISKGAGFVAFSTPEEAYRAIAEMNGRMVIRKPLYVALAQRKEERRAQLKAQFSQLGPLGIPSASPRMPMYPSGAPGLGQQFLYGQAPALIHLQAGFGYQQQLVPGMRPGSGPIPNVFASFVQQGQQRPGERLGNGPLHMTQQQRLPRRRGYRYPRGRNAPESPIADMSVDALTSALANASPEQQRTMLGEKLYPLVEQLERDSVAKVTGMLLEMDQTEVLHLLESPEALNAKVAEAMEVLRSAGPSNAADKFSSLSLE